MGRAQTAINTIASARLNPVALAALPAVCGLHAPLLAQVTAPPAASLPEIKVTDTGAAGGSSYGKPRRVVLALKARY